MTHVNVQAAKAHLPELLDLVEQGENIAVAYDCEAMADLGPQVPSPRAAFYGAWRGRVDMSRFDEADEEIAREFGMLD